MIDHQLDAIRYAMATIEPACIHPEITVEITVASLGYTVYCKTCHRKIIIPDTTLVRNENSFLGIITEVFGSEVGQRLARWY